MQPDPTRPSIAIVAEKPSVARDIARVVGASKQGDGFLHGNGHVVTWAIGHLVALAQPGEIRPEWRSWRPDMLPMLPRDWPLVVYEKTKDQFEVLRRILTSPKIGEVICATDAGREGELIFRYIQEKTGSDKPVRRLWVSSLTPEAIRRGLDAAKDLRAYDPLADAARGRSRADWLVGMNLSRAYTLALGETFSVGRVQTPTLAMLVGRELEIRAFVPEDYIEVAATFSPAVEGKSALKYKGTWFDPAKEPLQQAMRLPADGEAANAIVARAKSGEARIESVERENQRFAPPPLYDLTELQRHANRLYGFSAQRTLDLAQALYERHKLISYPRTDSRHLSTDVAKTLPRIVEAIRAPYEPNVAPDSGVRPLGKRFVDDAKVTDHHAIIPTPVSADTSRLDPDERRIHDLICRRLLSAWHDDHIAAVTTVITAITNPGYKDLYHSSGTAVVQPGWKALDIVIDRKKKKGADGEASEEDQALPSGLEPGQPQRVLDAEAIRKKTRPPKRFTEGTLLTAMETAGKTLDDKELSDAMKENGLGTPATRASIIEVLLEREYAARQGKTLVATDKGIRLIDVVHPEVKSPVMTGQWEAELGRIHKGAAQLDPFMGRVEEYVREVVAKVLPDGRVVAARRALAAEAPPPPARSAPSRRAPEPEDGRAGPPGWAGRESGNGAADDTVRAGAPSGPSAGPEVRNASPRSASESRPPALTGPAVAAASSDLEDLLHRSFGFASFRPGQEEICRTLIGGRDALVVMPTGSGKSLCYQLPGLALGGTTLVISPLIALMEDQVIKLQRAGFRAERIHSGRDRAASRQACVDYLNGALQFLFIAPERLRVPGFPEMLAKRKPSLVAIDEAHCISQWGHDFRPDYRMIGQHLPSLRPAAAVALTATATPLVQDDIHGQLGLGGERFIQGFRRDNIAIEVVESAPSRRADLVLRLLEDDERRPAIVYAPSRRETESIAALLAAEYPAAAYHAGMTASARDQVQSGFLAGHIEVIAATIAFGMGIDKPNIRTVIHTALPGSMEGYYQEIGRAGRDGKPSRAILMQAYSDRRTHDFFFERGYPDPVALKRLQSMLSDTPIPKDLLASRAKLTDDEFAAALEKLWVHGGAIVDYEENVSLGTADWQPSYRAQRQQKAAQLEIMLRYAESSDCRMVTMVRHFGDLKDARRPCGICDHCAPDDCVAQTFRDPDANERELAWRIVETLRGASAQGTGRLHAALGGDGQIDRNAFERLLGGLARAAYIKVEDASFEKDGKRIDFKKASLRHDGESASGVGDLDFVIRETLESEARPRSARGKAKPAKKTKPKAAAKSAPARGTAAVAPSAPPPSSIDDDLVAALKAWRLAEAKKQKIPAFRILTDKTLNEIADEMPETTAELLAIHGMGLRNVEKYGASIFRILAKAR